LLKDSGPESGGEEEGKRLGGYRKRVEGQACCRTSARVILFKDSGPESGGEEDGKRLGG
jgi:hypothetical protein